MKTNSNIAKNVIMLYIRIAVNMLLGLYSSRVILNALGVSDYGIFNIVCGVVVLFSFFNDSMSAATQRFINYAIGENKEGDINSIFSTSIILHICISIILLLISETIGLYIVNNTLTLPSERINAANIIYQIAIFNTIIGVIRVPLNALIIAFEKMTFYAYISIFETAFKLLNIIALLYINADKLILYSLMLLFANLITTIIYIFFIKHTLPKIRITKSINKIFLIKLTSFSGWTIMGSIANVGAAQGVNLITNYFYGVIINAAIGIANNVNGILYQFVSNLQIAFTPQTIQSYSQGNYIRLKELIYNNSKYSFFLLFLMGLPIIMNIDFILKIWLGSSIPPYSNIFISLIIISSFFDAICGSLWSTIQATGKIKKYQLIISSIIFSTVPISYICLYLGHKATIVFIINIIMKMGVTYYRCYYLTQLNLLNWSQIISNIFYPIIKVSIISVPLCYIERVCFCIENPISHFLTILLNVITIIFFILILGMNKREQNIIIIKAQKYIHKL